MRSASGERLLKGERKILCALMEQTIMVVHGREEK
jgi:hypothetical protein